MGIMDWYNEKLKKLDVWDIAALKVYVLLIGMIIGAYFPEWVMQNLLIIIVVIVLLMIKLLFKVFKK